MNRRELLLLGGMMSADRAVQAQQKAMPVIGFLGGTSPGPMGPFTAAFRQGLSETGYVEGQNLAIEYRWAEGRYDQLPALAADFVDRKVDVIVAGGGMPSALAAKTATSTIPVVFNVGTDPVESGLVTSLARPGGNITGFSPFQLEMMPKRLELLTELVPQARTIALLANPNDPNAERVLQVVPDAARTKGGAAFYLECQHRGRDRRRLRLPRPAASRRARRGERSVPRGLGPLEANCGAGIAPRHSHCIAGASIRFGRWPDLLWTGQ